jgi:hypothetical protein
VLDIGLGNALLVPCLDEARLHMDSLISEGDRHGAHATLMLVGSHYGGIDFDVVGEGCGPGRSESDILTIGSFAARGAEVLTCKVPATTVHL